jgi:alpha-L-rhamnosidase
MKTKRLIVTLISITLGLSAYAGSIRPTALTCEYDQSPLIDIQNPRLSWINENIKNTQGAAQTAYQIVVATSPEWFDRPLWDSGKKSTSESAFIVYNGPKLNSRTTYYWRVKVWDEKDKASKWSEPASWHVGMLDKNEWKAQWIGAPWQGEDSYDKMKSKEVQPAPLLRKEFNITKAVKEARFYGTGLGYFEMYINGQRVSEDYFAPNQTNYHTRDELNTRGIVVEDPFAEYTVMYLSYDVKNLLKQGDNALGVILGNGFYDVVEYWQPMGYGSPRFFGQIELVYEDGTTQIIASDSSWKAEKSAIVYDQLFFGEHYDARLEHPGWNTPGYDDSKWQGVALKNAPCGKLIPQNGPADRITKKYEAVEITKLEDGKFKVRFPEEISGWIALKNINAKAGQVIDIKYISESLMGANTYTANGSGKESYHARFTWFVFSEAIISGLDNITKEQIEALAVNSDVETSGEFKTSNELINKINHIWQRSQLDNMHGAIASDCPHRERAPYTGDGQVACVTVMHNFNAQTFYNKWIRDIRGAQIETGYVPNSAPWQPGSGGGIGWGAAMEIMPFEFYRHYGDLRILEQNAQAMYKHVRWMLTWVDPQTGVMFSQDPQQWKNLGDWLPPRTLPEKALVHTFFHWHCADLASQTAEILGHKEEAKEFAELREKAAAAFHKAFYNPETGSYGKHGSNVLALKIGVPQENKAKVVAALRANLAEVNDHIDTGIVGTRYLFEILCDNGLADLAYKIINQKDFPGYGWWIEQGATVTWENWNGADSHNHPMFGGGIGWFYRDLAGLRTIEPGFKTFEVKPVLPEGLDWVEYSHNTTQGEIEIKWIKKDGKFTISCEVPVGSEATIHVPSKGKQVGYKKSKFVENLGQKDGYELFKVKSGNYTFTF